MMDLVMQGLFQWLYGLVFELWDYIAQALINLVSMDAAFMESQLPILPRVRESMLILGGRCLSETSRFRL